MRAARLLFASVVLFHTGCVLPVERVATSVDSGAGGAGGGGGAGGTGGAGAADAGGTGGADAAGDGGAPSDGGPNALSIRRGSVLLMHMDELAWAGLFAEVIDDSGQGNNGTSTGDATTAPNGKFGRAGAFDGNLFVLVCDSASLQPTTALSFAAWVFPTGLDGLNAPGIIAKRNGVSDNNAFGLFFWTSNQLYVDIDSDNDRFHINYPFANNNWYHLAVVFDGSQPMNRRVSVYVNGMLMGQAPETSASIAPSIADLTIGDLPNGGQTFIGLIDEVGVWTRALDQAEIYYLQSNPL
jgi:hypothetical protein